MNTSPTPFLNYLDGSQIKEYGTPEILSELVGTPVKVELISRNSAPVFGNVYTIDPESKSIILVQYVDVEKLTPSRYVLIPGESVLQVRPITPPSPEDLPLPPALPTNNNNEIGQEPVDNLPANPVEALLPTPSSSGASFVSNSEELREHYKKLFRPSEAKAKHEARHAKKRTLIEVRNIFAKFCISRRDRIVAALNKRNIKFTNKHYQSRDPLHSIVAKKENDLAVSAADESAEDKAMELTVILVGALKIYPPYGEDDIICPNNKVKKNIVTILKSEKAFDDESTDE